MLEPQNGDFMYALADHHIKTGNLIQARLYSNQMKTAFPNEEIGDNILNYILQLEGRSK